MPGVTVFGVTGRMGQALVRLLSAAESSAASAADAAGLRLCGATCAAGSPRCGVEAASDGRPTGVLATDDVAASLRDAAVAVDFSRPQFVAAHAAACVRAAVPLVVGTTGMDPEALDALRAAALTIPVLVAPNTSLGVAVLMQLVGQASTALGPLFDVEIQEAHHREKRDAPSGTALALGSVVAQARGTTLTELAVFDRHGTHAPRTPGSIGFSVLRAADIVGEHTVVFAAAGERIEITHRATDRTIFARGALRAAAWLAAGRPAGLYGMQDVLAQAPGSSLAIDSHPRSR
jgi:4-hydroxy-tetrahydrodipicolinate reductase